MSKKKIKLGQLRIGMFITDLDIAWFKSPFFTHQRAISSQADIFALKESGVKTLTIDTDKGLDVEVKQGSSKKKPAKAVAPSSLKEELGVAKKLKSKAQKTIKNVLNAIAQDKPVVAKTLDPLVNDTLDSINRNDQALLTLLHMDQQGDALVTHAFSVMSLSLALGKLNGLKPSDLETLGQAALMHDVGWSKLPKNLLAAGKTFSASEQKLVQQHVVLGLKVLEKGSGFSKATQQLILQHHEYGNGSGYPKGLKAKDIHPIASLLTVIDTYDELVHGLGEGPGMIPTVAMRKLYAMAKEGSLDIRIVSNLVQLLGVYPLASPIVLNTGEKAVVTEINRSTPLLPIVTIYYNRHGSTLSRPVLVDLSKQEEDKPREIKNVIHLTDAGIDPANVLKPSL